MSKPVLKTNFETPPIPVPGFWTAWIEGTEEDGVRGFGQTEKEAIKDLGWQLDEETNAALVRS